MVSGLSVWIICWFSISTSFFNLFEVLFTLFICQILLYIYKWILVINSTLLMSFDVGKSRISDSSWRWERSNEIGNEGGASGLVFFGMQVELAFDVLKDNKRCYDNILSECGISDPLQASVLFWLAWWTWSWYAVLDTNFFDRHNAVLVSPSVM